MLGGDKGFDFALLIFGLILVAKGNYIPLCTYGIHIFLLLISFTPFSSKHMAPSEKFFFTRISICVTCMFVYVLHFPGVNFYFDEWINTRVPPKCNQNGSEFLFTTIDNFISSFKEKKLLPTFWL